MQTSDVSGPDSFSTNESETSTDLKTDLHCCLNSVLFTSLDGEDWSKILQVCQMLVGC